MILQNGRFSVSRSGVKWFIDFSLIVNVISFILNVVVWNIYLILLSGSFVILLFYLHRRIRE